MTVRIIAGRFKGRRLQAPPGLATRPLPDRIKQSIFDWLGQDLSGLRVADICAGSGAFGFEASSRGAGEVHLIEDSPQACSVLSTNIQHLQNPAEIHMHRQSFQRVLPDLSDLDLIFADPPFPWFQSEPATLCSLLDLSAASLRPGGRLMIRGESGHRLPKIPKGVEVIDGERYYGRSWVLLMVRTADAIDTAD